jgi:hypothetical protein
VHVDEDLAEPPVVIFAGAQINLVPADDGLLRVALAPARQLLALARETRSTTRSTTRSASAAARCVCGAAMKLSSASSSSSSSAISCELSGWLSLEPSR